MVFLVKGVCDYFGNYLVNYVGVSAVTDLRNRVFEKVIRQGAQFFESTSTGKLIPESTRVAEPSGYAALDSAALAGSAALRFAPAKRHGVAVATAFLQPVEFRQVGTTRTGTATLPQTPTPTPTPPPAAAPPPARPRPRPPVVRDTTRADTTRIPVPVPVPVPARPDTTRPDTTKARTDTSATAH